MSSCFDWYDLRKYTLKVNFEKKVPYLFVRVGYVCFENCTQWPLFLTVELIYSDSESSAGIENVHGQYSHCQEKSEIVLLLAMIVPMFQQCIF